MTRCNAMGIALQLLFTGLGVGSIYALVALGFVLIYRATNVVNFAQGDFAMLGAFSMVVLCVDLGLPYWLGILVTLVAMLLFGAALTLQSTIRCAGGSRVQACRVWAGARLAKHGVFQTPQSIHAKPVTESQLAFI